LYKRSFHYHSFRELSVGKDRFRQFLTCRTRSPVSKRLSSLTLKHQVSGAHANSTEDRTINPDLERFMAKRMGAKTIEVKASHLSLISQPDTISNLVLEAAEQI
jgi:hypothetical protein